jgi:crotonobetaine/carnitine-CoA ligase
MATTYADDPRREQTLAQVLKKRVQRVGDKPWVVTAERAYSYREIDTVSTRLGHGLMAAGIAKGETVLIFLPDTIDYIHIWCALAKFGAIEVPVNVHYQGGILAHVVNDSLAETMIVDRQYLDRLEVIRDEIETVQRLILYSEKADGTEPMLPESLAGRFEALRFEDLFSEAESEIPDGPVYNDLIGVMYTSGTTGPSKGAMITHCHAFEYAIVAVECLEMRSDDVYYGPLPMFHIAGQWAVIYAACIMDATAVLAGTFSIAAFWDDIRRHNATCCFLLGAMMNFVNNQEPRPDDADHSLKRIITAPLIPDVEAFKTRFGVLVSTTWGGTEMNCPMRSGFDLVDNRTCGRVAEDRYEVRLVDANDEEVPPGVPGEAVVRAKEPWILMAGYWRHDDWTARAWRNLWYHTGDMLMRDEAGNFYFVDRTKDAIRRRGENISSMEVEFEINAHPDVLESAVIPIDSAETEQEVMAVIVPRSGRRIDPEALIRFLEPRMAYFMVPRYVDLVEALPKTPTGKIQKYELRDADVTPSTWDRVAAGVKLKR